MPREFDSIFKRPARNGERILIHTHHACAKTLIILILLSYGAMYVLYKHGGLKPTAINRAPRWGEDIIKEKNLPE